MNHFEVARNDFVVFVDDKASETKEILLNQSRSIESIDDEIDFQAATGWLKELQNFLKGVESARKEVKEPLLSHGRKVDTLAKTLSASVEGEKSRLSALVAGYETRKREIQRVEVARQREALIESDPADPDLAEKINALQTTVKSSGVQVRTTYHFEIVDQLALYANHPALFDLVPNETRIKTAIKNGEKLEGIRSWQEQKSVIL